MSYISFTNPTPEPPTSLACKLQLSGAIRYYQMTSCTLTAEDNPAEALEVHIAVKRRTAVLEPATRSYGLYGKLAVN